MPVFSATDNHGKLFIEYTVKFPESITEEQAQAFKKLLV